MSNDERDIENLRHMLGAESRYKYTSWGFRNRYMATLDEADLDRQSMLRMAEKGLVIGGTITEHGQMFYATESGCKHIGLEDFQIKNALS